MIQIKNIASLQEGKQYNMISKHFNNAENKVNCISLDCTGLNRSIAYFCFTDRVKKVPTKEEFIKAFMNNKQLKHVFALWEHDINDNGDTELLYNL